ncbi:YbcC family protein [Dokdonella immobilis]|uniref:Probable inorganic carbon transporter subunit DabA n=1 Tax=Dokdonella immobilis TaxID=578942 RepID=A0A1I4X7P1_9GAMM|nr:DUF2309 domain-containing protein [Dokdonella immobilis]SFN21715.1 hypothetical protein SAMN05216289_10844 [Dokdonella immobilis]
MTLALMALPRNADASRAAAIETAIESACRSIAPTWPLDRFIAVSPYWEQIERPFAEVDARQRRLAGRGLQMPFDYFRETWRERRFDAGHLRTAVAEQGVAGEVEAIIAALESAHAPADERRPLPLPSDSLDRHRDLRHEPAWADLVTQQVSQFCAAWFDAGESDWAMPTGASLYADWRRAIAADRGIDLLVHLPQRKARVAMLEPDARAMIGQAVDALGILDAELEDFLHLVLMRINGWAAWCAYRRWQARLGGSEDDCLLELLAIRLAWECLLDDGRRDDHSSWADWRKAWQRRDPEPVGSRFARTCQRALEIAYEQRLGRSLAACTDRDEAAAEVLAVFCIDVRSEVFRRALEAVAPNLRTAGFAGFFGLPVAYAPIGTALREPRLPGLLAPALEVSERVVAGSDDDLRRRRGQRLQASAGWRSTWQLPAAAFGLVEALGIGHALKLVRRSLPATAARCAVTDAGLSKHELDSLRPRLVIAGSDVRKKRVDLAETVLRAMSLSRIEARVVALVGHGSQSANNAHAAGLDCGACGGQAGDLNARVLADLLNDSTVRAALPGRGLQIPDDTVFVAALHNTTTDEVELFEDHAIPGSQAPLVRGLVDALRAAGARARAERAATLGLDAASGDARLLRALHQRANHWAETRPEWGLAGNAAFIVAPRARSRGVDLGGRAFLHDYDWRSDRGEVLELIMTAPMVVAHWINMQYHASMVDPVLYGSGNKLLHNVVGGHIGVFEGNSGDLRIGLPLQSLYDGRRWMHEPLRLSVFIEAPRPMIDAVIERHAVVRQLVDNGWLHLFRIEPEGHAVEVRSGGAWIAGTEAAPVHD